ncbi:MAG: uroporphyrinogen-III synthase [Saprospiraceae bacterium]
MPKLRVFVSRNIDGDPAFQSIRKMANVEIIGRSLLALTPIPFDIPADKTFDWVCFLSRFGVKTFASALKSMLAVNSALQIAAFGKGTAEELRGIGVETHFTGTGKAKTTIPLLVDLVRNQQVLIPGASHSRDSLIGPLSAIASVSKLTIYHNEIDLEQVPEGQFDIYAFTSPMNVQCFTLKQKLNEEATYISLDLATEEALRIAGCKMVWICAEAHSKSLAEQIVKQIEELFQR